MAFATTTQSLNKAMISTPARSSTYSPLSQPSCSPRCVPIIPAVSRKQYARSRFATNAYRGGNCQDGYRRGFAWGPFTMGPDAAVAGAALADMARRFASSSQGFNQNLDPSQRQIPLFVDLMETDSQYVLAADVPGLQKSDLKITVNPKERTLKVTGERKRSSEFDSKTGSDEAQKFRRQFERRIGKFQRTFSMIPDNADLSSVSARVDKGVLTITVQKTVTAEVDDTMDITIE